ncbi:MAG: M28 family peptidase [Chitinophagales bacterium]|nr:M28 family peptidase [Chitinophagales bacterium]
MKYTYLFILFLLVTCVHSKAQENILITSPEVDQIIKGNHDPADYLPNNIINHPEEIAEGLVSGISADSLLSYLIQLSSFENRNTGSDTSSNTFGIGAARRWAYQKFEQFSEQNEQRLRPAYLQFDQVICEMGQHRNTIAVLPGVGPHRDEIIVVEGHMDSRCEEACDVDCMAHGMEDNGSGTALVLELARVMSAFTFDRTLVFMVTTGEEQGLFGANAFAEYCQNENIKIRAVYNNDIVGGIICGETASPPGCPGLNEVDSINVRLYSQAGSVISSSPSRLLARFTRLEYEENISSIVPVQSVINIMSQEDRSGRGGDHIPFRQRGYAAVRFTSANEHGNGNPSMADYHDRQHTMEDILGVDTDGDNLLDSFFVDFNYLARNAVINGNAMAASAMGPETPPAFTLEEIENGFRYEISDPNNYGTYRLGIRTFDNGTNYFDTLLTVNNPIDSIFGLMPETIYLITAAAVDSNGIESHFSEEQFENFVSDAEDIILPDRGITLLQNRPNPFDEATTIGIRVEQAVEYQQAFLSISDANGQELARYDIDLQPGLIQVTYSYYNHHFTPGTYYYSLIIDGQLFDTKAMIYAY